MDPINDTAGTNIASESNTEDNSHNINDGEMTDPDKNAVGAIDTAVSKSNADGTQSENASEVTGATHNGETIEMLNDDSYSMGVFDWITIVVTASSLGFYLLDVGTDIHLAVEYNNKGSVNYFWATLAFIIIPHLLVAFNDISMLWTDRKNNMAYIKEQKEDGSISQGYGENVEMITSNDGNEPEVKSQSTESTGSTYSNGGNGPRRACYALEACMPFDFTKNPKCFALRVILGLFGLGIIIRKLECVYYKFKFVKERHKQWRKWYERKLLEAQRDSSNLAIICAFTENCPQSLLQLHIFVQYPVPIYESIGRSIITSVLDIAFSYASYYRATRRQPKDEGSKLLRNDLHHGAFLFYYLGLFGAIIVRTLSIGLFMGTVSIQYTFIVLVSHFIGQFLFIHFYQKPQFSGLAISENLFLRLVSKITQELFYALVNVFLFVGLNDRTRKRWRFVANNLILYIENFSFLILSFSLSRVEYSDIYILVAGVGCLMHLVFLANYYRFLHPSAGICFACREDSNGEDVHTENHVTDFSHTPVDTEPIGGVLSVATGT